MRNKINETSSFQDFYNVAPQELQEYIDKCEQTYQSLEHHPEGNVKIHTQIVFNRAKRLKDINLMIAAFFHDLGKVDVTTPHPKYSNKWRAISHEKISTNLVIKYKEWIKSIGGNFDIIHYIVSNHMRIKSINKMRKHKRNLFLKDKYFNHLKYFTELDDMTKDFSNDIN